MARIVKFPAHRRQWFAAALIPLALAACGSKEPKPVESAAVEPRTRPVQVINAASPGVVGEPQPVTVTSYADAESVFKAGKYGDAKQLFARYVESNPENPAGYYMLGLSAWKSGDLTGAERAFERALERDPSHLKSLLNSARVLLDLGRVHEALERVSAARTLDSTSSETIRLLARVHDELGDAETAIKTYREALIRDERDVWAMNNLGMLYIRRREFDSALPPLARAVELRPTAPVFQNNLGIALELAGHPVEARRAYDAALRADSTFVKAVANVKRLSEVAIDSTQSATVSLKELAELFRQYVRMWKDSSSVPPTS